MLSAQMMGICKALDNIVCNGNPYDQELAAHLLHEIQDWLGRSKKWDGSTKGLTGTPSVTSTSMSPSRKTK